MGTRHETSDRPSRQAQLWEKAKAWFGKARSQIKYYWLCLALLAIALVSYVVVLCYQAQQPGDEAQYQVWDTWEVDWEEGRALLSIAYPKKLRLESPGESRPISVWLQEATLTPGHSPTPTRTPTPTSILTDTLTLTPTAILTPTPRPWVVAFSPHDKSILFVDQEGLSSAPQVALTPGAESAAPAVLYVQRAPLATEVTSISLNMSVHNPDATPVLVQALSSSISLESVKDAQCRHFRDLLCGPTTPLLVLAGSLVTFAAGEWRRRSEWAQKAKKRNVLAQVEQLANFISRPGEMITRYWELQKRTETELDWNDPEIIQGLNKTLTDHLDLDGLLKATGHWFGELDDERVFRCVQLALGWWDRENEQVQMFERVLNYIRSERKTAKPLSEEKAMEIADALYQIADKARDDRVRERATRLLAELVKKQKWTEEKIETYEIAEKGLRWLALWPASSPADPSAVSNWLKRIGLKFNPFGPEKSELDPRLCQYGVRTVFDQIRGQRPTILFGQPGHGITAAALLLAYDCENPPLSPREAGAFPVYWSPSILLNNNNSFLMRAACVAAQAVARYLVHRVDGFLKLPEPQRYGIARLLSLWAGSQERLKAELRRAGSGLGTPERLVREVAAIYQQVTPEQCLSNFPDLLADALPAGFDALYLILDLPTAFLKSHTTEVVVRDLRLLLNITVTLAAREIYLKLFLPENLRPYLGDVPACEVSTLTWSRDNLSAALKARIRAAGGDSLAALCGPDVAIESSPDTRLVRAADGSPRQLVRLGNELLRTHVQRAPDESRLSSKDIDTVLGPLDKAG